MVWVPPVGERMVVKGEQDKKLAKPVKGKKHVFGVGEVKRAVQVEYTWRAALELL